MKSNKWMALGAAVLSLSLLLSGAACTGPDPDGPDGPGDPGKDGPDSGGNQMTATLNIESAAPLRYNYKALLRSEKEGTQLYNQAEFSRRLVEGFAKLYPNVKLQFVEDGWGDALYQNQYLYITDWQNGGKMAVDIMIGETYMNYFASNGVFSALDASKFTNVLESACGDVTVGGKLYGVPMCTSIMGLQYNTKILTEAGIPEEDWVPATWAELKENCKKVSDYAKKNGKNYGGIVMNNVPGMSGAFRAVPFLRQAGGDIMTDNKLTLNSESNLEAFAYLRELASYAYPGSLTQESEDALQLYFTTRDYGAYMIEGAWSMTDAPENIKCAPLPAKNDDGTGVGNVFCGNVLFGVTEGSKNKQAAEAFLQYLTSEEVQNWLYELDGRLPINRATLSGEAIRTVHPNINPYIDQLLAGGFKGGLACFTTNSSDIWDIWGTFYKQVLTGEDEIKTLADEAQKDIQAKMS